MTSHDEINDCVTELMTVAAQFDQLKLPLTARRARILAQSVMDEDITVHAGWVALCKFENKLADYDEIRGEA